MRCVCIFYFPFRRGDLKFFQELKLLKTLVSNLYLLLVPLISCSKLPDPDILSIISLGTRNCCTKQVLFLFMSSAYSSGGVDPSSTGKNHSGLLPYIPLSCKLKDGTDIIIDFIHTEADVIAAQNLLNGAIIDGLSWPFDKPLSKSEFRNYFFAHTACVARSTSGEVIGAFYCKPNYPGRCSHFCNGGFITNPQWRRRGVAKIMATTYLRIAKDLGFRAVFFNLVFKSNEGSIKLWDGLGFQRLATLPRIAELSCGTDDAYQYYFDLEAEPIPRFRNLSMWVVSKAMYLLPIVCTGLLGFAVGKTSGSGTDSKE